MKDSVLSRWKAQKKNEDNNASVVRVPKGALIPLSQGQQRLWFLQQLYPQNSFYNYSESYVLKGELRKDDLIAGLRHVFQVNTILRSSYHDTGETTHQKINEGELVVQWFDIESVAVEEKKGRANAIILQSARQAFDLSVFPLVRAVLIRMDSHEHLLCLTMHHIVTDKWSMGILREQLAQYYSILGSDRSLPLALNNLQYEDYAFWQSKQTVPQEQLDYWKTKLSGEIPKLALPVDRQRGDSTDFKGAFHAKHLDPLLSKKIVQTAKDMGCTPYVLLLSVYYVLLYRYTGQNDILIGSPISNRGNRELEKMIGFFNETVVLRSTIDDSMSFAALVDNVRRTTLEAFSNKDVPFELLVKELNPERSLSVNPFFRVMFLYHQVLPAPSFGEDLELDHSVLDLGVAKFDLTLYVSEENDLLSTTFEYATDIFNEATIVQFQEHFEQLLGQIVLNQEQPVSKINMLTTKERSLFFETTKQTAEPYENYAGIHTVMVDAGNKDRNAVAVVCKENSITYGELLDRSDKYAAAILEVTAGKNEIVGLCAERSVEMIVGILAILKAGCAYLPIDPEYPSERVDFMLKDAQVAMVLAQKEVHSVFDNFEGKRLFFEGFTQNVNMPRAWPITDADDLAYVIYTSGSTGKPKGVPIKHRNIIKSTESRLSFYVNRPKAFLLLSSIAFDSSKAGIFWTLCTGGTLVIGEKHIEQDMAKLGIIIKGNAITHTLMLPTLYNLCLDHCDISNLGSLETVMVAGEACSPTLVKKHFETLPKVKLYNEYGPTEGTVWCIAHQITENDAATNVPIGRAVAHAKVYLLDKNHVPTPYGGIGEIYVGGPGLAGEYLNRPELTKTAYIDNPFDNEKQNRLYRTGDLGRYNSDGNIEFLGRVDQQIKIRGHRVELDEIEKVLLQPAAVEQTAILVKEFNGIKQLIAFVVLQAATDVEELKTILKKRLPKHMVPSKIIKLNFFPRLPNGKIDKKALAELDKSNAIKPKGQEDLELSETQKKLLEIWKEVLGMDSIGIHDNFFELGGDSILSIQIISKARKVGITITPSQLFEHQTIAELVTFVGEAADESGKKDTVVFGEIALTPIQYWFFETHRAAPNYWNQAMKISGLSYLTKALAEQATAFVLERHDALRSTFRLVDTKWKANILKPEALNAFVHFDFSKVALVAVENKMSETLKNIQTNLDIADGGLFKCVYFSLGVNENDIAVLLSHHLVVDVVSWHIIIEDFLACLKDTEKKPYHKTSSLKEWTGYLENASNSGIFHKEIDFWEKQGAGAKPLPSDFEEAFPIPEKSIKTLELILDTLVTDDLVTKASDAFGTKVDELIVTALVASIAQWAGMEDVSFAMERHGREVTNTSLDLSNTVGWFTSFFPITFRTNREEDLGSSIISVKEHMRAVPNGGIGYGVLRYLDKKLPPFDYPQIVFNFLGKQGASDTVVTFISEDVRHPLSERSYALEINAVIKDGELNMKWSFGTTMYKTETIEKLITDFDTILRNIILFCCTGQHGKFTPSDFPEAGLSQEDLDNLMGQF